jgi:autotransporter-associated beta strand protein
VADHANALGTGNITFSNLSGNTGTLRYTANSSATDWATRIVNSTGTIRLDTNGNDVTLAGAINTTNTNGLIKSGAGTLTLGGNNTYTGGTTLSTGTLLVTNSGGSGTGSGDVIVNAGILGGNGTISGNVALNGATIGSASNVLTLSSNLTTTGNSNVAATSTVNVAGTTTVSSGNFTLNGTLGGSGNVIVSSGAALVGNATINNATSLSGGTLGTSGNTLNLLSTLAASGNNTIATDVRVNVAGTTTISSGTFSVNGTLGDTGAKNVLSGATLAGSGTVEGPVAIFGTVAPGNSPGTLTQGATSFEAGGDYNWQVLDATGVAGTGFDTINLLSGNVLTINATSVTKFDINLWSLLSIAPDVNGVASNFIDTNSYSWTLVATDQPIVAFAADKFGIFTAANNGTDGFANSFTGTFGVALSGDNTDLMLTYTPIPEPSGYAALAGVGMIGFALYRRRRVAGQKAA